MNASKTSTGAVHGALVVRNTVLSGVQQVFGIGVGLVLTPLLLFWLGVEQYGVLLIVQLLSVSGLLGISDLGMQASLIRYLAAYHATGDRDRFRALLATGFALFFAIGLVCGLVVLGLTQTIFLDWFKVPAPFRGSAHVALLIYAATFPFQFGIYILKAFYVALQDFPRLKVWESLERILYLAGVIVVLRSSQGLLGVVIVEQAVVIGLAVLFVFVARRHASFSLRLQDASLEQLRGVAALSWQLFINYLLTFIVYQRAPEIITATLLGPVHVAYVGILTRVPRALKAVGSTVNGVVFPAAASLDAQDMHTRLGRLVLRGGRYAYLLLTPLVVFLMVFAADLLRVWVGAPFVPLANLFRMFVLWQYLMFLILLLRSAFTQPQQYRALLGTTIAGNVLFIGCGVGLTVIRQDLWGIAVGLILSALVTLAGYLRTLSSTTGFTLAELWAVSIRTPVLVSGAGCFLICVGLARLMPDMTAPYLLVVLGAVYLLHFAVVVRFVLSPRELRQFADGLRSAGGFTR